MVQLRRKAERIFFSFALSVRLRGRRKTQFMFQAQTTFTEVGKSQEEEEEGGCECGGVLFKLLLRCLLDVHVHSDLAAARDHLQLKDMSLEDMPR